VELGEAVQRLRDRERTHIRLLAAVLKADAGAIFPADLIAAGAIQRSLMISKGFLSMVGQSNYLCAGALLRLQLDNVMRLYAASLFPSGSDTLWAFLNDQPLSRLKAPDGRPLTDRELCTRVGKIYPWLPPVYERTSGFVHFSRPAIMSVVSVARKGRTLRLGVGKGFRRPWPRVSKLEAVQAFRAATDAVLEMVHAWGHAKARGAAQRGARG
jgi:hypothetical protein